MIEGSNFTSSADIAGSKWGTTYNISSQPAIEGSGVSCWYFFPGLSLNPDIMFQIFYQVEGNGIEEAKRNWGPDNSTVPGIWSYDSVPI